MREKMLGKLKQNKAFTLMEMMIAVAILVVLLGIGVLAISDWTTKLKMSELDGYAKTIYLEAQNQFASMEVEGKLPTFQEELQKHDVYKNRFLLAEPKDYSHNGNPSEKWGEICYLTDKDTIITEIIPSLSFMNEDGGRYLVELDALTGEIYAVFYWEEDNENFQSNDEKIYETICGMGKAEGDAHNRGLASRTEYEIGYYGGAISGTTVVTGSDLDQQVEIINGEELYVLVSYNVSGKMLNHINSDSFDIKFTIEDESPETDSLIYTFDAKKVDYVLSEDASRVEFAILLDSIVDGSDFESLTRDYFNQASQGIFQVAKHLNPGDEITVKVETSFCYNGVYFDPEPSVDSSNSIFAKVDGTDISIKAFRHLKNLEVVDFEMLGTDKVTINQNANLDFNNAQLAFDYSKEIPVYVGAGKTETKVDSIKPISNPDLFKISDVEKLQGKELVFDGKGSTISNLVIEDKDSVNVGLFSDLENVTLKNITLIDATVVASGSNNVGMLAGSVDGCVVENCATRLAPFYRDAAGVKKYYGKDTTYVGSFINLMEERYALHSVTGGDNVGGFIGYVSESDIDNCYAAVKVNGKNQIGGFVGFAEGKTTIDNCYASGDVTHISNGQNIGGFIGKSDGKSEPRANWLRINNAYSTGDIYGNQNIGGFVGSAKDSLYGYCNAYGEVFNRQGSDKFASTTNVGGFISIKAAVNSDVVWIYEPGVGTVSSCHYLKQIGYNANIHDFESDFAETYANLSVNLTGEVGLKNAATFAYDNALTYKAFPFTPVVGNHYGNFPSQYTINNSLVYYERYEDGKFGYYCVTTLEGDTEDNYVWVLDTLRDDTYCVEDGYALMSMYYLDTINYKVHQYEDESNDGRDNGSWKVIPREGANEEGFSTLNASDKTGKDSMVLLMDKTKSILEFKAYAPINNAKEDTYTADYSNSTQLSSFSTSGMYMYQLPYELQQNTNRYNVDNFYDVIVFDDGYAKGNAKADGGTPVIEDQVYYYCPHFSKLAVNPGMGVSESVSDFEKLDAPFTVYVRSARQLNRLGRVPYYWNDKGGGTNLVTYKQELDIDFGKYTKSYCGEPYDLLAFDTTYANVPIGEWNGDPSGYGAFQNDYDGNYYKIIDYCVKSDKQYVGLFGEIYKNGGATQAQIRNVVMTVSDPNQTETNAGRIVGTFLETAEPNKSLKKDNDRPRTGVGALVGSDYTIGAANKNVKVFTILNCAASGYTVEYHMTDGDGKKTQKPLGIAMGGLVGYSRGNIAQSSSVNDVKLVARGNMEGNEAAVMLGGFVGSYHYGTMRNCYSGGTIYLDDIDEKGKQYYVNRVRIGGVCPGWMEAPGPSNNYSSADVLYLNVYSYAGPHTSDTVRDVWDVQEEKNGKKFDHWIPTVGRMKLTYKEVGLLFWKEMKWDTQATTGADYGISVPGFSYYLTNAEREQWIKDSGAKEYFQSSGSNKRKTADAATYTKLGDLKWLTQSTDYEGVHFEKVDDGIYGDLVYANAAISYADDLVGRTYPFAAFVSRPKLDANGKRQYNANGQLLIEYVHYGDWPLQ